MSTLDSDLLNSKLPSRIADRLADAIIEGEFEPGARLSEQELAERFGTSRTPVREALRLLEQEALVVLVPRRGAQVSQIDAKRVVDIYTCRACLYGLAAKLATQVATSENLEELGKTVDEMADAVGRQDTHRYYDLNVAFHERISSLANNELLARMMNQFGRTTLRLRFQSLVFPGRLEASVGAHRRLIEAMQKRDPYRAEAIVRDLIRAAGDALLRQHYGDPERADYLAATLGGEVLIE